MEIIDDTAFAHAVLYTSLRPPRASMLVVVKATYALFDGEPAAIAEAQDAVTGALHHDDDPERSVRYPTDFALLKPRGECFVTGSVRPLTAQAVERTVAGFTIGAVTKSFTVSGDRRWTRSGPGAAASVPLPFTEMPLAWERAFGGPGHDDNPIGRGIAADRDGHVWLPNIEHADERPITAREDRRRPAGATPLGLRHVSRERLLGTYDERWKRTRFPWLAEDFRFAYFNEAPPDQQVDGHWRGDETIALRHLHPSSPSVRTRLPDLRARAFVEHAEGSRRARGRDTAGAFEELDLVLDTITVDADRGLALCVWRAALELDSDALRPDGVARLFLMDEARAARSSASDCHARMLARIALRTADEVALAGEEPPSTPPQDAFLTLPTGPSPELASMIAAAAAQAARPPEEDSDAMFEKVKAELRAAGLDPDAAAEEAQEHVPYGPHEPPSPDKIRAAFAAMGQDLAPELEAVLVELNARLRRPPAVAEAPSPSPPVDLRALVIELHRARRPLVGDFSGVDLAELDLRRLDARGAILTSANLRGANLRDARFDDASLAHAELLSCDLTGASFARADLTEALLEAADLTGANLDEASLEAAELSEATLDRATLRRADLSRARLSGASLAFAICDEADFGDANLSGASCADASFVEARLYGTVARGVNMDRAVLERARVGRGADLSGASIRSARADGSRWRDSRLEGANFRGTTLNGADFTGATLTAANLAGCSLRGAVFQGATLVGVGLSRANVFEGSFRESDLSGADLSGANLYGADFFRASAEGVVLLGANLDGTAWEAK